MVANKCCACLNYSSYTRTLLVVGSSTYQIYYQYLLDNNKVRAITRQHERMCRCDSSSISVALQTPSTTKNRDIMCNKLRQLGLQNTTCQHSRMLCDWRRVVKENQNLKEVKSSQVASPLSLYYYLSVSRHPSVREIKRELNDTSQTCCR